MERDDGASWERKQTVKTIDHRYAFHRICILEKPDQPPVMLLIEFNANLIEVLAAELIVKRLPHRFETVGEQPATLVGHAEPIAGNAHVQGTRRLMISSSSRAGGCGEYGSAVKAGFCWASRNGTVSGSTKRWRCSGRKPTSFHASLRTGRSVGTTHEPASRRPFVGRDRGHFVRNPRSYRLVIN